MKQPLTTLNWISILTVPTLMASQAFAVDKNAFNPSGINADMLLLILYISLALFFSFICSVAEAVLLSVTPSYIENMKENNPVRAARLKRLKQDNLDRSLAAILTLNTIAHTVGAIMAGAQATVVFGDTWFGLFSAVMTLMILFLSEIIPKTIGAVYWPKLTGPTVFFVSFIIVALYPIVWLSEKLTQIISRGEKTHIVSRDEFIAMARIGEQAGHINENELRVILNLFQFGSMTVNDIMTPRTVISALPENMLVKDAIEYITNNPVSRLPLYRTDIDHIVGFVLRDDILLKMSLDRHEESLKSFMREILVVPKKTSVSILLTRLLKERQYIAIVIDELGGTSGLVTLEDLIETLTGIEIIDEIDKVEDMRALARTLWKDRTRTLGFNSIIHDKDKAERP